MPKPFYKSPKEKIKPELDFEKELWKAADRLRGNIDVSEYKHIVLGLIFLKYVSDAFYQRREFLMDRTSDPASKEYYVPRENARKFIIEDRDQYKGVGVLFIPENSRWEFLRNRAMHSEIGRCIDEAMEAIENENPKQFKGVLPKIYTKAPLESHVLGELINIFSKDAEIYFKKIKPKTMCLYSETSILPLNLSAAFQSLSSKSNSGLIFSFFDL